MEPVKKSDPARRKRGSSLDFVEGHLSDAKKRNIIERPYRARLFLGANRCAFPTPLFLVSDPGMGDLTSGTE